MADADELETFVADAEAYFQLIDSFRDARPEALYTSLLERLSRLANSAVRIPFDMPETDDAASTHVLTSDERASVSRLIHETVADDIVTLQERHPDDDPSEQSRRVMYFDDLADLYSDLKDGLRCYATGTATGMSEGIWRWKWGYENHWGRHLMRALTTTHEICFQLFLT